MAADEPLSDAELCRRNGWGPGTVLEGAEGPHAVRLRITAVGERAVLASQVASRREGKPWDAVRGYEARWSLSDREWAEVDPRDFAFDEPVGLARLCADPSAPYGPADWVCLLRARAAQILAGIDGANGPAGGP